MKKVLVLGGTGAMGTYLVPKLIEDGYLVDVVSIDDRESTTNPRFIKADAHDPKVLNELLSNHYDGIIDFLIYNTDSIAHLLPILLRNTQHYIFLSSYRVFADKEHPIVESSPQLLQVSDDSELLESDDYCIYKARGELFLRNSPFKNWTIVRPAITYSQKRCQLITLERNHMLPFIRQGVPIPLCKSALSVYGTMSWACDVAEMLRRLLFNQQVLCEDFNVTTSEHHTWGEVADIYKDLFNLKYEKTEEDQYIKTLGDFNEQFRRAVRWQLHYDRLFNRIMDNTKVLKATGMKQSDLMPLYDGLLHERKTILGNN